jgi:hypothetical protein
MRILNRQCKCIWAPSMLVVGMGLVLTQQGNSPDQNNTARMSITSIPFRGTASGGELILGETINRNMGVAIIKTRRGESAAAVAGRLARFINENHPFGWYLTAVKAEGGTVSGLPGGWADYVPAGTETGLGIPMPPTALTCTHDVAGHALLLNWDNPPGGYDRSVLVYNFTNYDHTGGDDVAGNATSFSVNLADKPLNLDDLDVWVIGLREGIASNAAAIHVSGNALQELYGVPFTDGVAPNWVGWSQAGSVAFSQRIRPERLYGPGRPYRAIETAADKPFYQIVKLGRGGGEGGVYRKFKGLTPGHTYRIIVRVAVEDLDPSGAVSVYACAHGVPALTVAQLARRERAEVVSGTQPIARGGGFVDESMEVTLPAGVRNLTVWVHCRTAGPARVASDYLSLEDRSLKE